MADDKLVGLKFDGGKSRLDLLDPYFIEDLGKVLAFGAEKYDANSWQNVPNAIGRYRAALLRHCMALLKEELVDEESGLQHTAHIAANAMFLHWLTRHNPLTSEDSNG